jgi:imidazoleglycerol-phosphate dehydratase
MGSEAHHTQHTRRTRVTRTTTTTTPPSHHRHRFGEFTAPLDEALTHVVLDLSGRSHLSYDLAIPAQRIGSFDTELVEHFFSSFAATSGTTLHIRQLAGRNSHHIVEATFKAFARALRRATEVDGRRAGQVASSKGVLTQQ